MVDTIKATFLLDDIPDPVRNQTREDIQLFGLTFYPKIKPQLTSYYTYINNLYISLINERVTISNSLQTYGHGNNAGDFSYSELCSTILEIDNIFDGYFLDAKLTKIAIGLNLSNLFVDNWSSYKGRNFVPMTIGKSGKSYGRKVRFSQFLVKAYDKTVEQKSSHKRIIAEQITRIEKEISNLNHFRKRSIPIQIRTVRQLLQKDVMLALIRDLIETVSKIEIAEELSLSGLSVSEVKIIAAMQNIRVKSRIKEAFKETFKKDRAKYNKIYKERHSDYSERLLTTLTSKANQLIRS